MAWRHGHPNRLNIMRDVQGVHRMFRPTYVRVKRLKLIFDNTGSQVEAFVSIFDGDALVRPASGTTETYGLGTVENYKLVMMIRGDWGFRQGDIVTINDGREYEVQFPPVWFDTFTTLQLDQRSQIGQPT